MTHLQLFQDFVRGKEATHDDWKRYLASFHSENAHATPRSLADLRTAGGMTAYEHFAERVRALPDDCTILDLGCGDGSLVPALRRVKPNARIEGVDFAEGDIERARAVYGDSKTRFTCAEAADLPFAAGSFDGVVSHLALMLMDVPPVVREAARVLKRGARIEIVVDADAQDSPLATLRTLWGRFLMESYPDFVPPELPAAAYTMNDALASAGFDQASLHVTTYALRGSLTPASVWLLFENMYLVGSLPPDRRSALRDSIISTAAELAGPQGTLDIEMPMRAIHAALPH